MLAPNASEIRSPLRASRGRQRMIVTRADAGLDEERSQLVAVRA